MGDCPLTPRQLQVLALVARGLTLHGVSTCLQVRLRTAVQHMANIHDRLGTHSQAEAVYKAVKEGWLD